MKLPWPKDVPAVKSAIEASRDWLPQDLLLQADGVGDLHPADLPDLRAALFLIQDILWFAEAFGHEVGGVPLLNTRGFALFQSLLLEVEDLENGFVSPGLLPDPAKRTRKDGQAGGHRKFVRLRKDAYAAVDVLVAAASMSVKDARKAVQAELDLVFPTPTSAGQRPRSRHGLTLRSLERRSPPLVASRDMDNAAFALRAFGRVRRETSFWGLPERAFDGFSTNEATSLVIAELRKTAEAAKPVVDPNM